MNNDYFSVNSSDTSEQLALLDEFLSKNYEFRHNVLSDVYELRELGSESKPFRPFTREARNSLLRRIKCEGLAIQSLGQNVDEYVYSEETPLYLMQVNPDEPSLMTDSCRHFRPDTVCTYALGFLRQYRRMNKEQRRTFQLLCFRKIARTNFFYQLNGTRQTTPEEQLFIRQCAQEAGCDFPPDGFDHTFAAPAW